MLRYKIEFANGDTLVKDFEGRDALAKFIISDGEHIVSVTLIVPACPSGAGSGQGGQVDDAQYEKSKESYLQTSTPSLIEKLMK